MRKLLLFLLVITFNTAAYTQIIKGTVFDLNTKGTIYSASIYFNGTSAGALSDKDGNFEIDVTKYNSMPLTISALGYYSTTLTAFSKEKSLKVYLKPKLFELNEVVVNAKSHTRERKENIEIFRNEFLGTTPNALGCTILNENDLKFIYNTANDTVTAYASNPLQIENKSLGYIITYYLDKFQYCKAGSTFSFTGNMIFHEDSTATESQKKYFDRKREKAYLGSRMHFMRSLWINDLNSEGYTLRNNSNEILKYENIVIRKDSRTKYLQYPGEIGIAYFSTKVPTSRIIFTKMPVYFDANGYFDPSGISWDGDMAMPRIADMLPYDYLVRK